MFNGAVKSYAKLLFLTMFHGAVKSNAKQLLAIILSSCYAKQLLDLAVNFYKSSWNTS